jgi:dolichyl-diphosphooligosaccharide--protein glycosyltransferase
MTDAREVRSLLEDRPDLEPALETLLATDRDHATWTFDDADVDSGAFGELVAADVVEKVDGEYRLADADAVERALDGPVETTDDEGGGSRSLPSVDVDPRVAGALLAALALVLAFRLFPVGAVFRDGRVVLSGNDPYAYLYLVEELARTASGPFDLDALSGASFPATGEPLLVAVLWFVTALLGGVEAAPAVLAWYPAVAGVVTGLFVYLLATGLTDDERVGIASVVMLAVLPVLAFRSGLGFADHHAFDYVWLTLTAAAAVRLVRTPATRAAVTDRRTLAWAGVGGVAVTAQLLGWEAGPLLLFPLALYVPLAALLAIDDDTSPALSLAPLTAALALATVLTAGGHLALGWQTTTIAFTPALLLAGTVGVAGVATVVRRAPDLPVSRLRALAAVEATGAVVAYVLLTTVLSSFGERLFERLGLVATNDAIVEASSLFATSTFGWLFLFGLLLFLALPYVAWAFLRAASGDDGQGWLLAGLYGAFFLLLAAFQIRFAGELAPFVAVFAGLGFVHVAEQVELARPPVPFREPAAVRGDGGGRDPVFALPSARSAGALVFLFLLLAGLNLVQAPVKANGVTITDATYGAADWIEGDAEQRALTYPENYVFSEWGRNRVYNYFVNGQSRSYGYAYRNYGDFAGGTDLDQWYERLHDRVGYVVIGDADTPPGAIHSRLSRAGGGRTANASGSGHYRLSYAEGRQVYRLVPGANVTGMSAPNATVRVETTRTVSDVTFDYVRQTTAGPDGAFRVLVAYPGEYTVSTGAGNRTVTVPNAAVEEGGSVDAGAVGNGGAGGQSRLAPPGPIPAYQVSPS